MNKITASELVKWLNKVVREFGLFVSPNDKALVLQKAQEFLDERGEVECDCGIRVPHHHRRCRNCVDGDHSLCCDDFCACKCKLSTPPKKEEPIEKLDLEANLGTGKDFETILGKTFASIQIKINEIIHRENSRILNQKNL